MSKVFTGNVFISTSRQAIEKVFFSKDKLPTLNDKILSLNEEELKRSLIVTPQKNTNLVSFDYSFGSKNSDSNFLELTFIETDQLFEFFYVNKTVGSTLLTKLLQELKFNNITGKTYKRDIEVELFNSDADAFLNDNRIFFAFGVGDNLKEWSGPFVAELIGSYLSESSDGVREITLQYATTTPFFLSNFVNSRLRSGLENAINKYKRAVSNRRFIAAKAEVEVPFLEWKNVHKYFNELVNKYIKVCSNGSEVITLFPNMEFALEKSPYNQTVHQNADPFLALKENLQRGIRNQARIQSQIKDFYGSIGVDVTYIPASGIKEFVPLSPEISQEQFITRNGGKFKISMHTKDQIVDPEDPFPDFFWPLYNVASYFAQNYPSLVEGGSDFSDVEFYEESNIRILKLWKKYGFIERDDRPVIVFGCSTIIQGLLYLPFVNNLDEILLTPQVLKFIAQSDIDKYYSKAYQFEYFTIFLKTPISSSFKENVLIKDELALPEGTKDLIEIAGIPVFRYNLPNSNVISLNARYEDSYVGVYNLGFNVKSKLPFINANLNFVKSELEKDLDISTTLTDLIAGKINILTNRPKSFTNLVNNLTEWYDTFFKTDPKKFSLEFVLKRDLQKFKKEQIITYLALVINSNYKLGLELAKPFIEANTSKDIYLQNELLKYIEGVALQIRIRTIPFFKLAGPNILNNKKVLLLGSNNTIIGSENKKRLMPYSGLYVINEFRHVIDSNEMYSEFTLSKILGTGLPDDIASLDSSLINNLNSKIKAVSNEVSK